MKTFITGADGMLGSNTVRELLRRSYKVRAYIKDERYIKSLEGLDIERIYGDILDFEKLNTAMHGCQVVIHAAADTSIWPSKSRQVRNVNFLGTRNCTEAALNNNIEKFIYIGTATSFGHGTIENPGNENSQFRAEKFGLDYINSKYKAQRLVLNYAKINKLKALVINPTFMIGQYDSKPGSGELILAICKNKLPGYTCGGKNFVHVKDVSVAICNAIKKGRVGECYITGNKNLSYKEAFSLIARASNSKEPKRPIPVFLSLIYGLYNELLYHITNKKPVVSYRMANIARIGSYFSSEKAIKELGMPQTSIGVAVNDAYNWFREHDYL